MAFPNLEGTNTYGSSATSTSHTVPLPASGVSAGRLLLIAFCSTGLESITYSLSGWTFLGNALDGWQNSNTSAGTALRVAYKVAGSSESNPTFTTSATCEMAAISTVWSAQDGSTPINSTTTDDFNDTISGTTVPSTTTTVNECAVLRAFASTNTNVSWTGATEQAEVSCTGSVRNLTIATGTQSVAGATGTASASSGTRPVALTLAIAPSAVATAEDVVGMVAA